MWIHVAVIDMCGTATGRYFCTVAKSVGVGIPYIEISPISIEIYASMLETGKFSHTQGVLKRKSIHMAEFKFVGCWIGKTLGMATLPLLSPYTGCTLASAVGCPNDIVNVERTSIDVAQTSATSIVAAAALLLLLLLLTSVPKCSGCDPVSGPDPVVDNVEGESATAATTVVVVIAAAVPTISAGH